MNDERTARAAARSGWPVVVQQLDHSTASHADTAVARLQSVWRMTLDTWALSGRALPGYARADAPTRWRRLGDE